MDEDAAADQNKGDKRTGWKNKLCCSKRSWCSIAFSSCCAVVIACIVAPSVFVAQRNSSVYNGNLSADSRLLLNFSSFYCEGLSLSAGKNTSLNLLTNVSKENRTIVQDRRVTNFNTSLIFFLVFARRLDANVIVTANACVDSELHNSTFIHFITSDLTEVFLVRGICNVNETVFEYSTGTKFTFYSMFISNQKNNSHSSGTVRWTTAQYQTDISLSMSMANCSSVSTDAPCTLSIPFLSNDRVVLASSQQQNQVTVNCVTRPGSFVIIGILVFAVTLCMCLAILCPYIHCCFPKQQKHLPKRFQRFRTTINNYPAPDPRLAPVNNYPAPDPRPAPVNNYPTPDPRPAPVNNYPAAPDPRPAPVNNYPAPDPRPAPVNNYPAPDRYPRPAPVNNYPAPDRYPRPAPVNNYPAPDPRPAPANNYPAPDPRPAPVNNYCPAHDYNCHFDYPDLPPPYYS